MTISVQVSTHGHTARVVIERNGEEVQSVIQEPQTVMQYVAYAGTDLRIIEVIEKETAS